MSNFVLKNMGYDSARTDLSTENRYQHDDKLPVRGAKTLWLRVAYLRTLWCVEKREKYRVLANGFPLGEKGSKFNSNSHYFLLNFMQHFPSDFPQLKSAGTFVPSLSISFTSIFHRFSITFPAIVLDRGILLVFCWCFAGLSM